MIQVGEFQFDDAEAAKRFVRTLMARYKIGTEVTAHADFNFLFELLKRHPEYQSDWDETQAIRIVRNRRKCANELELVSSRGTTEQVAWISCL